MAEILVEKVYRVGVKTFETEVDAYRYARLHNLLEKEGVGRGGHWSFSMILEVLWEHRSDMRDILEVHPCQTPRS